MGAGYYTKALRIAMPTILASLVLTMADAKDVTYRPPRTADGHVDMQGVWLHYNLTPLERPSEFKTLVISAEQAAKVRAAEDADDNDFSRPNEPATYFDERAVRSIHGEFRSSMIIDPEDGLIPGNAYFKERKAWMRANRLKAFDGPEQRPLSERCVVSPTTAPLALVIPATDFRQIIQTKDAVVMATEEMHEARIVRMNATHIPAAIVTWLGDAIGWWEGDTLVIETKYLMPNIMGRAAPYGAYFVSPETIVVERMKRISDDQISYVFTVTDPTFYTRPWTGESVFTRTNDVLFESACHEGNYSLPNALSGARVLEAIEDKSNGTGR
jgi:hypothetical protein